MDLSNTTIVSNKVKRCFQKLSGMVSVVYSYTKVSIRSPRGIYYQGAIVREQISAVDGRSSFCLVWKLYECIRFELTGFSVTANMY